MHGRITDGDSSAVERMIFDRIVSSPPEWLLGILPRRVDTSVDQEVCPTLVTVGEL